MQLSSPLLRCLLVLPLLACALPAHADAPEPKRCRYDRVATLPVSYSGPALDMTIPGRINGTPATLLVNTGAPAGALTRTGAERRALPLLGTGAKVRGVGGHSRVYVANVDEIAIAGSRPHRGLAAVIGDFASPPPYDGIAGAAFLLQMDVEFSLATKELRFFRPTNCEDAHLAYWDQAAVSLPFLASYADDRNPEFNENPHFYVLLNEQKLRATIASAASSSVVTLDGAKRAGLALDAPGVERSGDAAGIGNGTVARWKATFDTLQLGGQTLRKVRLDVIDSNRLGADVLLGADFLRSHRVLFAVGQKKLYISRVGGEGFGQELAPAPWIVKEAEAGNGDAQLALARMYARGDGVQKDARQFEAWLHKAAASGNPQANFFIAYWLIDHGEYPEAAQRLRAGLDKLPGDRKAALWLHTARQRTGEAALGQRELEASFGRADKDEWPVPVAHYLLGQLGEEQLLEAAAEEREPAAARTCMARKHIAARHAALGDAGRARAVLQQQPGCSASAQ